MSFLGKLVIPALVLTFTCSTAIARESLMEASWYGPGMQCHHVKGKGCVPLTAQGDIFDMNDPTIVAHKTLPFGTKLLLRNPETGRMIIVSVEDRGPYVEGRDLDLTKAGAKALGFYCGPKCGTAKLAVTILN